MNQPDYILDIDGLSDDPPPHGDGRRRWLGLYFDCCSVYQRVYRNSDGSAYEGRCPHCLRAVAIPIGPGGVDTRFFRAE